jgi:hypothetical protein
MAKKIGNHIIRYMEGSSDGVLKKAVERAFFGFFIKTASENPVLCLPAGRQGRG